MSENNILDVFRKKYRDKEISWETMAAIGAVVDSPEIIAYAKKHEGGRVNMIAALEYLKQEGRLEGMIDAYRELNIPDDTIILKIQEKFNLSYEEALDYLKNN